MYLSLLEEMKSIFIFIIFIIIYIFTYALLYNNLYNDGNIKIQSKKNPNNTCDIKSCGALDPVSEPAYNMQQIVKQSILLEEHLTNKNKRCRDCITKHFLHIIGLAEEAQMLATKNFKDYPLLNESVELYTKLFQKWRENYKNNDESRILYICDELRNNRKKLIAIYFFDDNYDLNSKLVKH